VTEKNVNIPINVKDSIVHLVFIALVMPLALVWHASGKNSNLQTANGYGLCTDLKELNTIDIVGVNPIMVA
jgi:hypothetical protein